MTLFAVLFVVFMILKLTHNIDWSWWLVCLPIIFEVVLDWFLLTFLATIWKRTQ